MTKQSPATEIKLSVDENEKPRQCSECHTEMLVQEYQDFYQDECSACRLGVFGSSECNCGPCIPRTRVLTACPLCKFCKLHDNTPKWNNTHKKFECKQCRLYKDKQKQLVKNHCKEVKEEIKLVENQRKKVEFSKKWFVDPLSCYGVKKLRVLADRKKLSGRSRFDREELIEKLRPLLIKGDLPI